MQQESYLPNSCGDPTATATRKDPNAIPEAYTINCPDHTATRYPQRSCLGQNSSAQSVGLLWRCARRGVEVCVGACGCERCGLADLGRAQCGLWVVSSATVRRVVNDDGLGGGDAKGAARRSVVCWG